MIIVGLTAWYAYWARIESFEAPCSTTARSAVRGGVHEHYLQLEIHIDRKQTMIEHKQVLPQQTQPWESYGRGVT